MDAVSHPSCLGHLPRNAPALAGATVHDLSFQSSAGNKFPMMLGVGLVFEPLSLRHRPTPGFLPSRPRIQDSDTNQALKNTSISAPVEPAHPTSLTPAMPSGPRSCRPLPSPLPGNQTRSQLSTVPVSRPLPKVPIPGMHPQSGPANVSRLPTPELKPHPRSAGCSATVFATTQQKPQAQSAGAATIPSRTMANETAHSDARRHMPIASTSQSNPAPHILLRAAASNPNLPLSRTPSPHGSTASSTTRERKPLFFVRPFSSAQRFTGVHQRSPSTPPVMGCAFRSASPQPMSANEDKPRPNVLKKSHWQRTPSPTASKPVIIKLDSPGPPRPRVLKKRSRQLSIVTPTFDLFSDFVAPPAAVAPPKQEKPIAAPLPFPPAAPKKKRSSKIPPPIMIPPPSAILHVPSFDSGEQRSAGSSKQQVYAEVPVATASRLPTPPPGGPISRPEVSPPPFAAPPMAMPSVPSYVEKPRSRYSHSPSPTLALLPLQRTGPAENQPQPVAAGVPPALAVPTALEIKKRKPTIIATTPETLNESPTAAELSPESRSGGDILVDSPLAVVAALRRHSSFSSPTATSPASLELSTPLLTPLPTKATKEQKVRQLHQLTVIIPKPHGISTKQQTEKSLPQIRQPPPVAEDVTPGDAVSIRDGESYRAATPKIKLRRIHAIKRTRTTRRRNTRQLSSIMVREQPIVWDNVSKMLLTRRTNARTSSTDSVTSCLSSPSMYSQDSGEPRDIRFFNDDEVEQQCDWLMETLKEDVDAFVQTHTYGKPDSYYAFQLKATELTLPLHV